MLTKAHHWNMFWASSFLLAPLHYFVLISTPSTLTWSLVTRFPDQNYIFGVHSLYKWYEYRPQYSPFTVIWTLINAAFKMSYCRLIQNHRESMKLKPPQTALVKDDAKITLHYDNTKPYFRYCQNRIIILYLIIAKNCNSTQIKKPT
jgi:hypothetical protein